MSNADSPVISTDKEVEEESSPAKEQTEPFDSTDGVQPEDTVDAPEERKWKPSARALRRPEDLMTIRVADEDDSLQRYREALLGEAATQHIGDPSDPRVLVLDSLTIEFAAESDDDSAPSRPSPTPASSSAGSGAQDPSATPAASVSPASHAPAPPIVIPVQNPRCAAVLKRSEIVIPEGVQYRVRLRFRIQHVLVTGLRWANVARFAGLRVYRVSEPIGSFAPRAQPYEWVSEWHAVPGGILVRKRSLKGAHVLTDDDASAGMPVVEYGFTIRKSAPADPQLGELTQDPVEGA
eukprot:TRINITY_DN21662_c0_g1_i1.p1 TRINITY_DN21662_c0_g1~~TRINITY_DN21662_c0_g1_i1.p1  ORF type:complete len:312 (-),score=39.64 TRINITY_DN21662_c0_g1_i1:136-1017(-)